MAGSTMPSTVVERLIRTKQRRTSTVVPHAAILCRAGKRTRAKTKVKWGADSRREPQTAVAGSKLAPATGQPGVEMERTAQVAEAATAWATEVYRLGPVLVPRAAVSAVLHAAAAEARVQVVHV